MSDAKGYNGWSNYETWNVKLWIDNDEGSYRYWTEHTEETIKDKQDRDEAVSSIAGTLQAEHEENMPEVNGTYADLLSAALSEVDWYEIAESLVADALDNDPSLLETEEESA